MKKVFIVLLIVGVLMAGACAVIENVSQEDSYQEVDFSNGEAFQGPGCQDPLPHGEGGPGGGGPPAPG